MSSSLEHDSLYPEMKMPLSIGGEELLISPSNTILRFFMPGEGVYDYCEHSGDTIIAFRPTSDQLDAMVAIGIPYYLQKEPDATALNLYFS